MVRAGASLVLLAPLAFLLACGGPGDGAQPYRSAGRDAATPRAPSPDRPGSASESPEEPPPEEPLPEEPQPEEPVVPEDCPRVRVAGTGGQPLNVRPTPATSGDPVGQLAEGQLADVTDVDAAGEEIAGDTTWYRVATGPLDGWVSGAFAVCTTDEPAEAPDGYLLPLACGTQASITQGNHSSFSHNGKAAYAFDFSLVADTPLLAMQDGVVVLAKNDIQPGHPCYSGGGSSCANDVNYVVVDHGDATATLYLHLNEASVDVGDTVLRGQQVGLSGGTGWSTGPHAHVQRQELCGSWWCQSLELSFADVGGAGVPAAGDVVVSENGC